MPSICSAIYFDDYVHIKILTYFRLIWVERKLNAPSYTTLLVAHFRQCHTPSFKAHFHREDCDVLLSVCRERSINVRSLLLSPQSPPSPPSTPNMDLYFIQIDGLVGDSLLIIPPSIVLCSCVSLRSEQHCAASPK